MVVKVGMASSSSATSSKPPNHIIKKIKTSIKYKTNTHEQAIHSSSSKPADAPVAAVPAALGQQP